MVDLHLHLDGSLNPKNVPEMAKMSGIRLDVSAEELKKILMVEPDCSNLGEYLEKFDLPLELLQTKECIEYAVYELMRDLEQQGLCYAEIRFAPQLHRKRNLSQEEVVWAAICGLNRGNKDFSVSAQLILCCMRGEDNESENIETIRVAEAYLGRGICAVDLAGNESAYPTKMFEKVFKVAREKQIPVVIHAGEAAGAESIRQALAFGAVRIGHGIHAMEDPELMQNLKSNHICLEMCYSSNLQTKTVESSEYYPIVGFLKLGMAVTLNTDNMTVSHTTLQREYQLLQKSFSIEDQTLLKIAQNALNASFLEVDQKEQMRKRIDQEFFDWLKEDIK